MHAAEEYFLTSGEAIRCFFEKGAFDEEGRLKSDAHLCLNKLGHAMHDLDPVFDGFSRTPELAAIASGIGMQKPLLLQSMYIFKQSRIGGEVTCHTDHTYLWTEPRSVVGFWFAIDDATTENGCMWALPGGHHLPVKARSRLNASRTATELEEFDANPYPGRTGSFGSGSRHADSSRWRAAASIRPESQRQAAARLHAPRDRRYRGLSSGQLAAAAEPAAPRLQGVRSTGTSMTLSTGRPFNAAAWRTASSLGPS